MHTKSRRGVTRASPHRPRRRSVTRRRRRRRAGGNLRLARHRQLLQLQTWIACPRRQKSARNSSRAAEIKTKSLVSWPAGRVVFKIQRQQPRRRVSLSTDSCVDGCDNDSVIRFLCLEIHQGAVIGSDAAAAPPPSCMDLEAPMARRTWLPPSSGGRTNSHQRRGQVSPSCSMSGHRKSAPA